MCSRDIQRKLVEVHMTMCRYNTCARPGHPRARVQLQSLRQGGAPGLGPRYMVDEQTARGLD